MIDNKFDKYIFLFFVTIFRFLCAFGFMISGEFIATGYPFYITLLAAALATGCFPIIKWLEKEGGL